jgi:hypothetical protein
VTVTLAVAVTVTASVTVIIQYDNSVSHKQPREVTPDFMKTIY